jgi:iron complex outermembrane receptor protein
MHRFAAARGAAAVGARRRAVLIGSAAAAALVTALAGPALAQDGASAGAGKGTEVGEVVVTATGTNISGVKPVGSEAVALDRRQIDDTGKTTVADVLRTLPQVQTLGYQETSIDTSYGGGFGGAQAASITANPTHGDSINIRGLGGNNTTLVLVDGRRPAPSGVPSSFQEAVQVPLAALERIEVIADGASAIYGSDAISGVVNYVLRKHFDGLQLTGRYMTNDYGDGWSGAAVGGHSWDHVGGLGEGNIVVSYEHTYTGAILRGDIPQLRSDLRPFGGEDLRLVGTGGPVSGSNGGYAYPGDPGNIVVYQGTNFANPSNPREVNYLYYGLPTLSGGQVPTAAQVLSGLNQPNLVDRADYEDYQPRVRRDQLSVILHQDITPDLSVYYEGFFTKRDSDTRVFQSNNVDANRALWVQVNPGTPYYIPGLTGATNTPYYVQYNTLAHYAPNGGLFYNSNTETTYTNTLGVKAKLPKAWNAEAYATYGLNNACGVCFIGSFISSDTPVFLDQEVNAGRVNPYTTDPIDSEEVKRLSGSNIQRGQNQFTDAVLKFDGPLFKAPGGEVKLAVGGEYAYWVNKVQNGANRPCDQYILGANPACATADNVFRWDAHSRTPRQQWAGFAELYVPIVGEGNGVPFVEELNLDAAVRHDRYTVFGATTNPKIGVTWKLGSDLQLRGSWGTSYRAPSLQDTDPGVFSVAVQIAPFPNFSGDPRLPTLPFGPFSNVLLRLGANPDVKPEKGRHWSLGFDLTPHFVPGLKLSGTYYDITYKDRIGAPNLFPNYFLTPGSVNSLAYLSPFLSAIPATPGCVNSDPSTYPKALQDIIKGNLYGPDTIGFLYGASTLTNPCGLQVIIDQRVTNLAKTHQTGLDLSASYAIDTAFGGVNFSGGVSHIFQNKEQAVEGGPVNDALDRIGYPVSWRGRGTVGIFHGPVSANLSLNYVGGYTNDLPIQRYVSGSTTPVTDPQSQVPSWTTFDLNLNYSFPDRFGLSALKNVRASININNLFDRAAPVVLTGAVAADVSKHNVLGRQWQFVLVKTF